MLSRNFIVHDNVGLNLRDGPPQYQANDKFNQFDGKVKCLATSKNGARVAWIANGEVSVVEAPNWNQIGTLKHPRGQDLCFSPSGSYLAVWDIYTKVDGASPAPNLSIYDVSGRKKLKTFFQQSQINWQPQWTNDEELMARIVTSEVHFYKASDPTQVQMKYVAQKMRSFSLSPSIKNHYTTFFVPGVKDVPAIVKLYKYPKFSSLPIASKNVFKVESVESFWNEQSTAVLLLTTHEAEKGASYYGRQMLFYMDLRGESNRVTFSKEGSVRSVAWAKSGKEFFCVYGAAPAKATLFNNKCDAIVEFGEGARNLVLPNSVGNIVLLGGMGNMASRFEMWDIVKNKLIGQQECSDITHMQWSPCGQYLLTSTCSPRLRVNNGYKVFHYSGALQNEKLYEQGELYQATWLPNPQSAQEFSINYDKVQGIETEVKTASKERYMPPSQRAQLAASGGYYDTSKKFLSQREDHNKGVTDEDPKAVKKRLAIQKKKDEAKLKRDDIKGLNTDWRTEKAPVSEQPDQPLEPVDKAQINKANRIKNLNKKLMNIKRLKGLKDSGKELSDQDEAKLLEVEKVQKELDKLSL